MSYEIYCIRHIKSGRCYVGLTKTGLAYRWHLHLSAMRRGNNPHPLYTAMREHSPEAFEMTLLVGGIGTLAEAHRIERKETVRLNAYVPSGFNGTGMPEEARRRSKGTVWIHSGATAKQVDPNDPIPEGWSRGVFWYPGSASQHALEYSKQEVDPIITLGETWKKLTSELLKAGWTRRRIMRKVRTIKDDK